MCQRKAVIHEGITCISERPKAWHIIGRGVNPCEVSPSQQEPRRGDRGFTVINNMHGMVSLCHPFGVLITMRRYYRGSATAAPLPMFCLSFGLPLKQVPRS